MRILEEAFTFDDVLLVPNHSNVLPRSVSVATKLTTNITLNVPIVSAAMDTVTESRLAIALAEQGGMGILHKNMDTERQVEEVRKVKKFESGVVKDPITVSPSTSVGELLELTAYHNISGMPVVDGQALLGIITSRDVRFETRMNRPVEQLMTPKDRLITVDEGVTREQAIELFRKHRIEKLLIINKQFELRGMITLKDILRSEENPNACKTDSGQLRVGAAVGTDDSSKERVTQLITAGVDVIVVDTAHGHHQSVLDQVKWVKTNYPTTEVIGGNIATADAALALADAGANAVKVGMGPGSICTTRIVAGVGVPQITAISNISTALKGRDVCIIADGGIRFSGDVCKAIAAGADSIMVGGLFAGTEEAPGEVVLYQGRSYKSYRGMGSVSAMSQSHGSSDRYFQKENSGEVGKLVPEGIEGRVPYKGLLKQVVHQLVGGLRSSMGYTGCDSIPDLQQHARFVRVTNAGMRESHVHDVTITKEAPNYSVEKA